MTILRLAAFLCAGGLAGWFAAVVLLPLAPGAIDALRELRYQLGHIGNVGDYPDDSREGDE